MVQMFATNTRARKIQLKNELNTVERKNMSVNNYTLKIKSICESLASINVTVDDDDKIEVCLRGLGSKYKSFATSIQTRKNMPSFADLVSMLIIEEKSLEHVSLQSKGNLEQQLFYSNTSRGHGGQGHGCGGYGGGQTGNQQQQQNSES